MKRYSPVDYPNTGYRLGGLYHSYPRGYRIERPWVRPSKKFCPELVMSARVGELRRCELLSYDWAAHPPMDSIQRIVTMEMNVHSMKYHRELKGLPR